MIIITGGAGFIGSNLVAALDGAGEPDIVVCDRLGSDGKWRNIARHPLRDPILPEDLPAYIAANYREISTIFHMGAISATTALDADLVARTNFTYSVDLWRLCATRRVPLIYASSAATYGNGDAGFDDVNTLEHLRTLRPLNLYGWSKWLFDCWVLKALDRGEPAPPSWAGVRFFNVFGPNEYHKEAMRSLVCKIAERYAPGDAVELFKSHRSEIAHGDQKRDFVWVDDVVDVMLWLRGRAEPAGIVNLGTGKARSFLDLATATIRACGGEPKIEFVDMPAAIQPNYQYFTCANLERLRCLGYEKEFTPLEDAVDRYVREHLSTADPYR